MSFYIALFFSVVMLVMVVLQYWPKTTTNTDNPFLFPMAAMAAISIVALLAPVPVNLLYKGAILFGLVIATLAVIFCHMPTMPRYVGYAHFLIVYFLYFIAFSAANRLVLPSPIILLIIAFAFLAFWFAREHVAEQWGALVAYIVLLSMMVWSASEIWVQQRELWATMVFGGALLLVLSDTLTLVSGVKRPYLWLRVTSTVTLYFGHLLIAWSIWGFGITTL